MAKEVKKNHEGIQDVSQEVMKEEKVDAQAQALEDEEYENVSDADLPFPKATIVNMLRKHLDPGKQIKGQVKVEMNKWLGSMVERIAKKMNEHPYSYVDQSMLKDAIEVYEKMQDIEQERDRIITYLEKIKSDCDLLEREVERKFEL